MLLMIHQFDVVISGKEEREVTGYRKERGEITMRDKSKGAKCDEERRAYGYMTAETMLERGEREREDKGEVCDGWMEQHDKLRQ